MQVEQMNVTYGGVVIAYDEGANRWTFTLRGRERSAESLAKAKEVIDKPVPAEKAKPFERITAIRGGAYSDEFKYGEITSIAEAGYLRSSPQVWFSVNGNRSKESASLLYADTKENREVIAQIDAMREQAAMLNKKAAQKCGELAKLVIEVPE